MGEGWLCALRVRTTVDAEMDAIIGGKNVFVGPTHDRAGGLKVAEGEALSNDFLYRQWD